MKSHLLHNVTVCVADVLYGLNTVLTSVYPLIPGSREDLPFTPLKVKVAGSLNSLLARLKVQEQAQEDTPQEEEVGEW